MKIKSEKYRIIELRRIRKIAVELRRGKKWANKKALLERFSISTFTFNYNLFL